MKEKYKNLYNLLIILKLFDIRLYKESIEFPFPIKKECINSIDLNDDILNDIIQLILDESGLTLEELIADINATIKSRNTKKEPHIRNKKQLFNYMRESYSNCILLIKPVDQMIRWDLTKKGYTFYSILNNKVNQSLNVFKDTIINHQYGK